MAPGAFRHGLLHLHQGQNGGGDLVFPHGDDLIHILPAQLEGQIAGALDRNAVGNGSHTAQLHRTALPDGLLHGGRALSLDADHPAGGLEVLDGIGNAADESAAADGDHHLAHIRQLLQDLQANGTLSGNDVGIVEGMGKGIAVLLVRRSASRAASSYTPGTSTTSAP